MKDDELTSPQAFALAVNSRASYLSRIADYESRDLRRFAQLTLLLGIDLEGAAELLRTRGLRGAYGAAVAAAEADLQRLET